MFLLAAGVGGGLLLSLSEDTHTFMGAQHRRFASEARDDERGIIQMPDEPNKTEAGKRMGGCCSILVGIPLVCIFGLGFYIWDFARIKSWGVGAKSVEWLPKQASDITFISGDINRIAEFDIDRDSLAKWCDSIGKPLKPVAEGQNASIWRVNPYLKQFGINNNDRSFKTAATAEEDFSSSSKHFTAGDLFYEDRWSNGGGYLIGYDVSEGRGYYQYSHH